METLIDLFELHATALPGAASSAQAAALGTYRTFAPTPARAVRQSADLDVDVEDPDARIPTTQLSSERWHRARLWSSED